MSPTQTGRIAKYPGNIDNEIIALARSCPLTVNDAEKIYLAAGMI